MTPADECRSSVVECRERLHGFLEMLSDVEPALRELPESEYVGVNSGCVTVFWYLETDPVVAVFSRKGMSWHKQCASNDCSDCGNDIQSLRLALQEISRKQTTDWHDLGEVT